MGILSSAPYIVELDAASLARIAAMVRASSVFIPFYTAAMNASVQHVITKSKQHAATSFKHPTGTLMRGITGRVVNPWTGVAGVGQQVPYARRREFGFSGMRDRLGRYYPHDPGAFYMHRGLADSRAFISEAYGAATLAALKVIVL